MSVAAQLYPLQLTDTEWNELTGRLAAVESGLGESRDLVMAREAVSEEKEEIAGLKVQLRDLELETAALNTKLKANQDRLYSGRVRNPKELSGLHDEAAALRRRRSELEDGQLELMIAIEEAEGEMAERQARLRQIEANWRQEQAGLLSEKEDLQRRLAELEEQRTELRARIARADLALYDDLRERYGGIAVVLLRRGICQTCGVDVPTGVARAVERGEGMYYCPVCSRLLYGGQ
jgi:predicted  nucleic acid-binding Zn-ribbon protein